MNTITKEELAQNQNAQIQNNIENQIIETSVKQDTVSPNAIIIQKKYYRDCDHLVREEQEIPNELVNKTEEDVKEQFPGWKIQEYSPTEIILYQEFDGYCDEHYVAREHNGLIGIYHINEQGIEKLKEDTEISTMYLPEEDVEKLKIGVPIIGRKNLYNFLEDYE